MNSEDLTMYSGERIVTPGVFSPKLVAGDWKLEAGPQLVGEKHLFLLRWIFFGTRVIFLKKRFIP